MKDFCQKKRKGGKLEEKWIGLYIITSQLSKGFCFLQSLENPSQIVN